MAQVPDRVLSWLWSVVQTYTHPRQVYNDAAATLSQYPTLKPKTAVYTYENGQTALLLCLSGPFAADTRNAECTYPLQLWLPQNYADRGVGIICYVQAGQDVAVRPGQHVAIDGRIYHPYLRDWGVHERSSITGFLQILSGVFAREPPLATRNQSLPGTPSAPPPPPKLKPGESARPSASSSRGPPPLPAKPGQADVAGPSRSDGPPLPPLPPGVQSQQQSPRYREYSSPTSARPFPPSPSTPRFQHGQTPHSPVSPSPGSGHFSGPVHPQHSVNSQFANQQHQPHYQSVHSHVPQQPPWNQANGTPQHPQYAYQNQAPRQAPSQAAQPPKPAPALDLLTDPFDISLTPAAATGPAPPIPPNPEREHLLHMLSESLVAQATHKVQQAQSAIAPLTAQWHALSEAHSRLQSELQQLQQLDAVLDTNEAILHQSIRDCTKVIEASRQMPQPNIDEVLVAPTVAAQQLWNLCADEVAIKEAMYCLQRAVGAGRVGSAEFVRLTRSLARECFLKMALARKVATGLGLDVQGDTYRS